MKPILVHVHIYYHYMWAELKDYLKNLEDYNYELHITIVEDNQDLKDDILRFRSDAKIYKLDNFGYDVGPFVHIINLLNLDDYSYVIKLHTKRDVEDGVIIYNKYQAYSLEGNKWRNYLLSFLENKNCINNIINNMQQESNIGMVANYRLIIRKERYDVIGMRKAREYLKQLNLYNNDTAYVAGTMFIVRASLLKPIKSLNFKLNDFEYSVSENKKTSLAHVIERLLGLLVIAQNHDIVDNYSDKSFVTQSFINFIYYKISRILPRLIRSVKKKINKVKK